MLLPRNSPREKIVEILKLEPFLTISQIAAVLYSVRGDGTPAKATKFRPRKNKEYTLAGGYHSARPMLERMVRDKELLKWYTIEQSRPNLYSLPGRKKPVNDRHLYGHEMDCANVFVALWKTGLLESWEAHWSPDLKESVGKRFNVWPDRIFELEGSEQVFFLEVDRGTEELNKQIKSKLDNYLKMSLALGKEQPFTVLFTAQGYRHHANDQERFDDLVPYLKAMKRGLQFVIALHQDVLSDPLGAVYLNPHDGSRFGLLDLDRLNEERHTKRTS